MDLKFGDRTPQRQPGGERITVGYFETDGLLGLCLKNFLLNLVTLSIYRFWAKTNVRRHIWSNIKINGQSLEYTGTGKELFLGAILIFVIFILPYIAAVTYLQLSFGPESPWVIGLQFVFILVFLLLYGMAIYRARRYRLSRTLWRGIRGTLTGSPGSFSMLFFGAMILRSMTMGWSTPAMNLNIQQRMIGDMEFGDKQFKFSGRAGPLYKTYAICWFLTPVIMFLVGLGLAGIAASIGGFGGSLDEESMQELFKSAGWVATFIIGIVLIIVAYAVLWTLYTAREMQIFAEYTSFDNANFRLDATVPSLVGLALGNIAILILTLGIGQPYIVQRTVRYLCDRLSVDGTVDVAAIQQSTAAFDKRGEGLVDAFDIDAF